MQSSYFFIMKIDDGKHLKLFVDTCYWLIFILVVNNFLQQWEKNSCFLDNL